jgi:hypothetical protein
MIGQVLPGDINYNFKGVLDEIRVYNRALSATEIKDLYDQTSAIESDENNAIPDNYSLSQNFPNPFNPLTMINYQLPITDKVELSIYNLLGQKVATLVSESQKAGYHSAQWDASVFASGVYFYRIITDNGFSNTKKLILLK